MSDSEKEPPHGEQVYRRRVLASTRQKSSLDGERWSVEEVEKARERLMSVEAMLSPVNEANTTPFQRASLEIEKIWLRFKTGKISGSERQSNLGRTLNYWEINNHEVFDQLTQENGDGITLLAGIRNRVIPPINIGGFYTKRR